MGEVQVPADKYWGGKHNAHVQFQNCPEASMPKEIIAAFAYLKKAAAYTNTDCGVLGADKRDQIAAVCDEILEVVYHPSFRCDLANRFRARNRT